MSNDSENVSVTMPVKITSSERLTAIQLSAPPMHGRADAGEGHAQQHRDADPIAEDRRRVAAEPGERADAEEQLAGAAEDAR